MPFYSIITINLNNVDGLQATMKSVLKQTFRDFEYIVIDGGSTDGSLEKILEVKDQLAYCVSEKDKGIYDAMNKGIALASGDYCLFLNSGDYLYKPDVLQCVYAEMESNDILYGDILSAKDGKILHRTSSPAKISIPFLLAGVIPHPAQIIRRSLFDNYGHYNPTLKLSSDYEFFVKVFFGDQHSFKYVPIPISVFDLSGISSSPKHVDLFYSERKEIQRKYFPAVYAQSYAVLTSILRSKLLDNSVVKPIISGLKGGALKLMGEKKSQS